MNNSNSKITSFRVTMPQWVRVLPLDHAVINHATEVLKKYTAGIKKMSDDSPAKAFKASEFFTGLETTNVDEAAGVITYTLSPHEDLFFRVLTDIAGVNITSQAELLAYVSHVSAAKREYDKLREALAQVEQTGYGVVVPTWQSYQLEQPQLHRNGKNFGVRFRANASSLHIVRVDVKSEVAPIIGGQQQSEEMLKHLQQEYETNSQTVWNTPIFGKSLESIVREDISNKSISMPGTARVKMRGAITKIVNNSRGGVICILV